MAFYLVKRRLELSDQAGRRDGRRHLALNLTFIVGIYLLAASYGDHEVTNYLHARFCANDTSSDLCRIVIFNDDEFSHWVFFAGFVLINGALMLLQVLFPRHGRLTASDKALLVVNGVFIGLGVFANLAFEVIGPDLYIVALLALISAGLLWRRGPQPPAALLRHGVLAGLDRDVCIQGSGRMRSRDWRLESETALPYLHF